MYNDYDYSYTYLDDEDEVVEYSNYNSPEEEYDPDDYNDYDEYDDKKQDFPYRNKIIIGIIILMVAFLLIWLIPQFFKNKNEEKTSKISINKTLATIKKASLSYFKEDNIPTETNQVEKITLREFKSKTNIEDISSKQIKLSSSYIEITKNEHNYTLKIKLVTEEQTKEKTYNISNYSYCTNTYLCEEEEIMDANEIVDEDNEENIEIENTDSESSTSTTPSAINAKNYLYEYSKTVNGKLSNWSLWNVYERVDCSKASITCKDDDFNCLEEIKLYNRKEKIGTHSVAYQASRNAYVNTGVETKTGCLNNDYVKINENYYKTTTTGQFSSIGALSKNSPHNVGNWIYKGRSSFQAPPSDTLTTRYVFVSNESSCTNCSSSPYYTYDIYSYTAALSQITNLSSNCSNLAYKTVPSYSIASQNINITRNEPIYGTVCYKSIRTRSITNKGITTKKWSSYNNKELLNNNYTYTGNKKEK